MFTKESLKENNILRYTLVAMGVAVVLVSLAVIVSRTEPSTPQGVALSSQEETTLQEQIAPLIKAGDMKACDQVQNDMYRKVCINNIALNKAESTKDISYCNYIDGTLVPKSACERQVVFALSEERADKTLCTKASDPGVRKECEDSFPIRVAMKQGSPESCAQATNSTECRDQYFLQKFATDPKNIDCKSFSTSDAQNDCVLFKPLFSSPIPDMTKLAGACGNAKSTPFLFMCRNFAPGAQGVTP